MVRYVGMMLLLAGVTTGAQAQNTQETLTATVVSQAAGGATCTQGSNKRTVAIMSKDASGKGVPCEVHYKKETEQPGHDQVIYTANNDVSFCEAKAKAFVEKLTGMGWTCQ
jgi:hypothetical protein